MKRYLLLVFMVLAGCQQVPNKKMQIYYSSPELAGTLSIDGQPVINAKIYLLTACEDQSTVTDLSGSFSFSPACVEFIPTVSNDELGFLYQVIVDIGVKQFLWQMSGLGYGVKRVQSDIDLSSRIVIYTVDDNVNEPYEKITDLEVLPDNAE